MKSISLSISAIEKKLYEVFGNLDIVDAESSLKLFPSGEDFKTATQNDPRNCGFQRAATRVCGATGAVVFRSAAYFDYPGKDGVRRIYRHIPSPEARAVIKLFDNKGADAVPLDRTFDFYAPSNSLTLKYMRAKSKIMRNGPHKIVNQAWQATRKVRDEEIKLKQATADLERFKDKLKKVMDQKSPASAVAIETKKQVERVSKDVSIRRKRLTENRATAADLKKKADKIRKRPFRNQMANGHIHNLEARNGMGFFTGVQTKIAAEKRRGQ